MYLFNDLLLLQLTLLLILVFVSLTSDYLFIVFNSTLFLVAFGIILWFSELDVYVNFLMVIDLGVFFVLAALLVNFIPMFQVYISSTTRPIFLVALVLISFAAFPVNVKSDIPSTFGVVFYNWFDVFGLNYFSDLQLLSDVYYVFNCFEFLVMNVYLYLTIFTVYIFFTLKKLLESSSASGKGVFNNSGTYSVIMKQQDFHKQSQQVATVRVWSRQRPATERF